MRSTSMCSDPSHLANGTVKLPLDWSSFKTLEDRVFQADVSVEDYLDHLVPSSAPYSDAGISLDPDAFTKYNPSKQPEFRNIRDLVRVSLPIIVQLMLMSHWPAGRAEAYLPSSPRSKSSRSWPSGLRDTTAYRFQRLS